MPEHTEQVMQVFLNDPNGVFLKADLVRQVMNEEGLSLDSHSIAGPMKWLFEYRYIVETPGPGRHRRYQLKARRPAWPPVNVRG